jgi:hypothetical protein
MLRNMQIKKLDKEIERLKSLPSGKDLAKKALDVAYDNFNFDKWDHHIIDGSVMTMSGPDGYRPDMHTIIRLITPTIHIEIKWSLVRRHSDEEFRLTYARIKNISDNNIEYYDGGWVEYMEPYEYNEDDAKLLELLNEYSGQSTDIYFVEADCVEISEEEEEEDD